MRLRPLNTVSFVSGTALIASLSCAWIPGRGSEDGAPDGSAGSTNPSGCASDGECAAGQYCTAPQPCGAQATTCVGKCAPKTPFLAECYTDDAVCVDGDCRSTPSVGFICTIACTADADCGGAGVCDEGFCAPPCSSHGEAYACIGGRRVPCTEPAAQEVNCYECGCGDTADCLEHTCVPREVVVPAGAGAKAYALLDDGYVYYSVEVPKGGYTTDVDWKVLRVPKEGGSAVDVFSATNLELHVIGRDSLAYYAYGDGTIKRVPLDTLEVTDFAGKSLGLLPFFCTQSESQMFVEYSSAYVARLVRIDKPDGAWGTWELPGLVETAAVESDGLHFVLGPFVGSDDSPAAYVLTHAGTIQKRFELPDLCGYFLRDPVTKGWIAFCYPGDIVSIDSTGQVATVAAGVVSAVWFHTLRGRVVFWTGEIWQDELWSYDLDTGILRALHFKEQDSVFAVDDEHAYYLMEGGGFARKLLSAAVATE